MRTTSSPLPLNLPFFLLLTSLSQTSARPITGAASLSASTAHDASLESGSSSQIYVSNLSLHTTDESLKSNFEQFGTVIGTEVISDT
jgi:RNA recognition motif-containing protein